eukprot:6680444-Ditylum_brightwellii.AAC.1
MRSGNISLLSSSAKQLLTKQGCPNGKSWKTWSKLLKLFANGDQLKVPLKQLFVPMLALQRNWPIFLDYNEDILYVRLADKFCQYSPSAQNSHVFTSGSDTKWTPMDTSSPVQATSIDGSQLWALTHKTFYTSILAPASPTVSTFKSHLNTLQEWEQMIIQNTECHALIHHTAKLMARPTTTILVVSDGSISEQENTMSFGWVISPLNLITLTTYSGPAYGHMSLFCAEGYSLLLITHFLYHLQRCTQLTLACNACINIDNKGVVIRETNQIEYEYDYPCNTSEPNWDVIAQLA